MLLRARTAGRTTGSRRVQRNWGWQGPGVSACLLAGLLIAALVPAGSAHATKPATGVAGRIVYQGWITYTGNNTDQRVLANCGASGKASRAPEGDHRTLHVKFKITFAHVTLSRKGAAIQEHGATATLRSSTYTDRGINYAAPAGVDPGECRGKLKKVTWSCRGRLVRPAEGFLLLRRENTDFNLEINPIEVLNSKPRTCRHATYPGDSPEQYPSSVNAATAADFTGYWDDQWNFAEYGLLQSLPTRWGIDVHRGDFAKFARTSHSIHRDIARSDDQNSAFTDCSSPDDPANINDACDQTLTGHAEAKFTVTRVLH